MGFVFFLVCGFITASLVKPLIYYILYIKGGFPIDDTECDRFGINTIWCVVSGALLSYTGAKTAYACIADTAPI